MLVSMKVTDMLIQRRQTDRQHYCSWDDVVLGWSWLRNFLIRDLYVLDVIIIIITSIFIVGCGYMDWIGLVQDRDRWRTLVSAVMNLRVP